MNENTKEAAMVAMRDLTDTLVDPMIEMRDLIHHLPEGPERDKYLSRLDYLMGRVKHLVGDVLPQIRIDKNGRVRAECTALWRSEVEAAMAVFWQDA